MDPRELPPLRDPKTGISIRFVRQWAPQRDLQFSVLSDPNGWGITPFQRALTDEDREFLAEGWIAPW